MLWSHLLIKKPFFLSLQTFWNAFHVSFGFPQSRRTLWFRSISFAFQILFQKLLLYLETYLCIIYITAIHLLHMMQGFNQPFFLLLPCFHRLFLYLLIRAYCTLHSAQYTHLPSTNSFQVSELFSIWKYMQFLSLQFLLFIQLSLFDFLHCIKPAWFLYHNDWYWNHFWFYF